MPGGLALTAVFPRGHRELGGLWVRRETREIPEKMDGT